MSSISWFPVRKSVFYFLVAVIAIACAAIAQAQVPGANSDAAYVSLKNIAAGSESLKMENVVLRREFATFTFKSGILYFAAPVGGKVTGAVFFGEGSMVLNPVAAIEKRSLSLLTRKDEFEESFNTVVFRFTDNSYEELKKLAPLASAAGDSGRASSALQSNLHTLRSNRYTRYNLSARILQDLLATSPGGLFVAFVDGKKYSGKEVFIVDPQGVRMYGLSPEEVAFVTYDENNGGQWAVSHLAKEIADKTANGSEYRVPYHIERQKLDIQIDKSAELHGTALATVVAKRDGMRVVPLTVFRHFNLESVTDETGTPLSYVYEPPSWSDAEWDDSDNYSVILPRALAAGEKTTIKTVYQGRDAVRNEGNGNYYPRQREDWFPGVGSGDYTQYEMTFRIPKGLKIAATGTLLSETTDGAWTITEWKTDVPIGVAGFNFGRFKSLEEKLNDGSIIASYANEEPPQWVQNLKHAVNGDYGSGQHRLGGGLNGVALGTMDTSGMVKRPLAEAQLAMQLYTDYFGPVPYKRLSMSQQTACNFGQAWPGLVWLPICSFFDSTVRHELGVDDTKQPYWNVVTPHEVAHQWWGHAVGWSSYRDQWMSEGFAEFSAALFAQAYYTKDPALYHRIWAMHERALQEKNSVGNRPIDIAPVTMGFRANYDKIGYAYRDLAYGKGAFILHMLRMMMWDKGSGDQNFKAMMQDFVRTYSNRPASTEDFKAIVERHMLPNMNFDGNGKMDWFFNEWVYGMELPKYDFTYTLAQENGGTVLSFKLSQSNVSQSFKMAVPVYVELPSGSVGMLGSINVVGNSTVDQKVPLGNLNPKRVLINYNNDVLSVQNF